MGLQEKFKLITLVCLVTGMILRCVIFVDKITRLEIMTTTRELFLGESPEVFHLKAFDDEGEGADFHSSLSFSQSLPSV